MDLNDLKENEDNRTREEERAAQQDALLMRVADGDMDALEQLYRQTSSAVFAYALSIVQNRATAEDIMQDAFVNIAQNAEKYTSQGKPMAWIMTITRNLALMKLKKSENKNISLQDYTETGTDKDSYSHSENKMLLQSALDKLKEDEKQIIVLHALTGLKHREIAEILEMPLPTVLTKYKRSLEKMRKMLGGDGIE